jgi:hypothetical protein
VGVPHSVQVTPINDGQAFDSTNGDAGKKNGGKKDGGKKDGGKKD